jgi:hypothetical protein
VIDAIFEFVLADSDIVYLVNCEEIRLIAPPVLLRATLNSDSDVETLDDMPEVTDNHIDEVCVFRAG